MDEIRVYLLSCTSSVLISLTGRGFEGDIKLDVVVVQLIRGEQRVCSIVWVKECRKRL